MTEKLKNVLKGAFKKLPINESVIVFESENDLSDNTYALFEYLTGKETATRNRYVWLVDQEKEARLSEPGKIVFVNKRARKHYFKRLFYLSICKYFIYDHNNFFDRMNIQKKEGEQNE